MRKQQWVNYLRNKVSREWHMTTTDLYRAIRIVRTLFSQEQRAQRFVHFLNENWTDHYPMFENSLWRDLHTDTDSININELNIPCLKVTGLSYIAALHIHKREKFKFIYNLFKKHDRTERYRMLYSKVEIKTNQRKEKSLKI